MPNTRVQQLWAANKAAVNGWLAIGNPFTAEIMAEQGYDSITVDLQHGLLDYQSAVAMFQALRASGVTIWARVPWLEPGVIMKVLDAGVHGIICPMVNTAEQAARLVDYTRYPPQGNRSFGPVRANLTMGADYPQRANDEVMCLAMIETAEAVENLEAIVQTSGLNGVYIGPSDLTLSLTQGRIAAGFDREEEEIVSAITKIMRAAHQAQLRACLHCGTPAYAAKAVSWGFDMVTVSGDTRLLAAAAAASVHQTRELMGDANQSATEASNSY